MSSFSRLNMIALTCIMSFTTLASVNLFSSSSSAEKQNISYSRTQQSASQTVHHSIPQFAKIKPFDPGAQLKTNSRKESVTLASRQVNPALPKASIKTVSMAVNSASKPVKPASKTTASNQVNTSSKTGNTALKPAKSVTNTTASKTVNASSKSVKTVSKTVTTVSKTIAKPAALSKANVKSARSNSSIELNVVATAYSIPNGITKMGTRFREGIIAVDPRVIPLGTKVYVEGYGEATAEDTGGAVKGHRIDVAFDTHREAINWGVKKVKLQILSSP